MSKVHRHEALVIRPGGRAFDDAIMEIEETVGVAENGYPSGKVTVSTPCWGGAFQNEQDWIGMIALIRSHNPKIVLLIAFEDQDPNEQLAKNTAQFRQHVPFNLQEDPDWPKTIRAFYIKDGDEALSWREVLPYEE